MALDIEGLSAPSFDRHMPIKPLIIDEARFRKQPLPRNGRNTNARAGGAHIAKHDPEADLDALPAETRKKIEDQRGKVQTDRAGKGSVDIFTVEDEDGTKRTIIDL